MSKQLPEIAVLSEKEGKIGDSQSWRLPPLFYCNGQFAVFDDNATLGKTVKSWHNSDNHNRRIVVKKTISLAFSAMLPKSLVNPCAQKSWHFGHRGKPYLAKLGHKDFFLGNATWRA